MSSEVFVQWPACVFIRMCNVAYNIVLASQPCTVCDFIMLTLRSVFVPFL